MNPYWIVLASAIIISMAGQTLLKAGAGAGTFVGQLFDLRTLLGLCLYGGAALLYMIALRRIPVSVALPCTAISYVVIRHRAFRFWRADRRAAGRGIGADLRWRGDARNRLIPRFTCPTTTLQAS